MAWIPPGTLIAGSPLGAVPRVPDVEPAGVAVELTGFYIDHYLFPNEAGALPETNLSQPEALAACARVGKRLCTELELERACKGDQNQTYPYGQSYRAEACGTGRGGDSLVPNGLHAACASPFGVFDLHGSVWTWTASGFGRGSEGLVTLKGGNSSYGELVARCAHARGEKPTTKATHIGFRCCAGALNAAAVDLVVKRGPPLRYRRDDEVNAAAFEGAIAKLPGLSEGAQDAGAAGHSPAAAAFQVERVWEWHPLGNEELLLAGGCAIAEGKKQCGVFAGRVSDRGVALAMFVSSDRWQPTISEGPSPRELHVMGGDEAGAFRKLVAWDWGKVTIFGKERKKGRRRWVAD